MDRGRIIPGEAHGSGSVSSWKLPEVDDPHQKARKQDEAKKPALSVEEVERIQRDAYNEAYKQGKREGYDAGFKEGRDAGRQQGEAQGRDIVAQLKGILDSVSDPVAELDQDVEDELVDMVFTIAQQVIHRELHAQPGEIVAVIREAVGMLPFSQREVRIQVHPDDARFIRENLGDGEMAWQLVEDPAVTRGGCIVNTPTSRVDATLEKRIKAIAVDLLGTKRKDATDDAEEEASENEPDSEPADQARPEGEQ